MNDLKRRIQDRVDRIIGSKPHKILPVKAQPVNNIKNRILERVKNMISKIRSSEWKEIISKPLVLIFDEKRLNEALIVFHYLGFKEKIVIIFLQRLELQPEMTTKSIIRAGMIRLEQSPILFDDDEDDEWINQSAKFFLDDLDRRFMKNVMEELLLDDSKPYSIPILLIETERPEIQQLVRKFILFSSHIKPFTSRRINPPVKEGLEKPTKKTEYGKMHILVNLN